MSRKTTLYQEPCPRVSDPLQADWAGRAIARVRRVRAPMAVLAVLAALLAVLLLRGSYEIEPSRVLGVGREAPAAWTRPCWVLHPRHATRPFSSRCVRLRGTVLFAERIDPDGDGDRHLLLLAGPHLVKVKYRRGLHVGSLPGIGATVRIVGRQPSAPGAVVVVEPSAPR
jgi:hypothetical protein